MYFKPFLEVRSAIPQWLCRDRCLSQPCFAICPTSCGVQAGVWLSQQHWETWGVPTPGASSQAEVQQGKGTGPKLSSPKQLKNLPTNPGTLVFNRSLSTPFYSWTVQSSCACSWIPTVQRDPNTSTCPQPGGSFGTLCLVSPAPVQHRHFSSLSQGLASLSCCWGSCLL